MALQKITTGMEKGPEAIDANFKALDANSSKILTDWSSDGISYKNGCFSQSVYKVKYRIIKLGDTNFLALEGWLDVPALDTNQTIVAFTLPANVVSQVDKLGLAIGENHSSYGDLLSDYSLHTDTGDFSIHNQNSRGDGKASAGGYKIEFGFWA
jgi:hypothetical protein